MLSGFDVRQAFQNFFLPWGNRVKRAVPACSNGGDDEQILQ